MHRNKIVGYNQVAGRETLRNIIFYSFSPTIDEQVRGSARCAAATDALAASSHPQRCARRTLRRRL